MDNNINFLKALKSRGFVHQCSDENAVSALNTDKGQGIYIGFDATAPSLHVGSLLQIMVLKRLQMAGFTPVVLFGGGTTLVGDPSGKARERPLLSSDEINQNIEGQKDIFKAFLSDDGKNKVKYLNNIEWLKDLNYIDFLRDVGKHFSVNRMMGFDSVKLRLSSESGLSFLEFNYMLMQAYDFYILSRDHEVVIQGGGSDQWGNIVCGIDLTRRLLSKEVYGITSPLMTTANGVKMGKSEGGAVWLSGKLLPDFDFWQYWRNIDDRDVGRFLRLFTLLDDDEILELERLKDEKINQAKICLANEVTAMARGKDAAKAAQNAAKNIFIEGNNTSDLPYVELKLDQINDKISSTDQVCRLTAPDLFCGAGFTKSRSEARRFMKDGGLKFEDKKITDAEELLVLEKGKRYKISLGKKRHTLVGFS